ncbi:aspartyl-phosphate phosphatase Spo0E family protein [Aneurinibacillus aneurinilyticus]|uniref:aspartyl-phosphate phosphatase Spo0E family protein n=1 Tax=Aneurinibacillus aneurinilyticus TaxID=1391 RepID=UPI001F104B7B|nr:aspartyl-phosphate phosphatase Spo0E family protein [Aneurinibacillus aneurinilyticus]MCI1692217.1 aspartyl-phosphate phosphatase Spo0E family protein [Aneurinibacillus aneurinilyticus]MED0669141.1 aspartyl-phosphate phosphatase Spo0E family protein [Aneurinibacillus aneurinilyticus]
MCIYMEHNDMSLTSQLESLQQEITQLREIMYKLAKEKKSLSHPDVVEISQQLDAKLNLHHQFFHSH